MINDDSLRVRVWRYRAEELRAMAGGFGDWKARRDLILVADQWDAMARRLESRMPVNLSRSLPSDQTDRAG